MNDLLVSVVLPVYNVEEYLNRSVESVVCQTYKNIEILLVDDGSSDSSSSICEDWARKDSRIRVIHKENAGLSMARNTGIEEAKGEYILFLDSDDYVESNLIENCVATILNTEAQIVVYGYDRIAKNGSVIVSSVPELPSLVMNGKEIKDVVIPCLAGPMIKNGKKYHMASSVWAAMYSLDVIRKNRFRFTSEREIISEDIYSNLIYYSYINVIAIIPKVFYHYCENNDKSLTRVYDSNRFERNKYFYKETVKLCDKLGYSPQVKKNLSNQVLSNIIVSIKQTVDSELPEKEKKKILRTILNDNVSQKVLLDYDINLDNNVFRKILINCMKRKIVGAVLFLIWIKNRL